MPTRRYGHRAIRFGEKGPDWETGSVSDRKTSVLVLGGSPALGVSVDGNVSRYSTARNAWQRIHGKMPLLKAFTAHAVDGDIIVCGRNGPSADECWRLSDAARWQWVHVHTGPIAAAATHKPPVF